ncbi:MAG: HNH endonuclease [Methylobacterium sp.]|nr:HNH endonuclease [Methylobacterium sp.]MCA3639721.1 HNH endonuclease [Methylobacterium sp.]
MANCRVRWRSSGGRGEFEYVPADTLEDRVIEVLFEPLNLTIPAEVMGVKAQGKARLRKADKNNRRKFHLPQLVMAVARLPEPGREDLSHTVAFPLENKAFVMDAMDFEIIEDDGITATLAPLRVSILHSAFQIDLQDRFSAIAEDLAKIADVEAKHPFLAAAIRNHGTEVMKGVNSTSIRAAADEIIHLQAEIFGMTNAGSAVVLENATAKPETDLEAEIVGIEGRLLTRIHAYKERDRAFAAMAKKHYKAKNGGKLTCEACGMDPVALYGADGERCIEAHHKVPIEELQPDSITRVEDMAMVCASCHRIIHSRRPCLKVEDVTKTL